MPSHLNAKGNLLVSKGSCCCDDFATVVSAVGACLNVICDSNHTCSYVIK